MNFDSTPPRSKTFTSPTSPRRRPPSLFVQAVDLLLIQLSNWRWSWHHTLITSIVTPLMGMVALGSFAKSASAEGLAYVFTGNIVLGLTFENQNKVAGNFAFMRAMGTLDFFATLPVRRWVLILMTVLSFLILSLPSLAATIVVGTWLLGVPLHVHPLLVVAVPILAFPLAGLGALIGVLARSPETASSISLCTSILFVGLGPVMIPPDRLPPLLAKIGFLSPATYAASMLRQTLLGPITGRFAIDAAVLLAWAALTLWAASANMVWRQGS